MFHIGIFSSYDHMAVLETIMIATALSEQPSNKSDNINKVVTSC